MNDLTSTQLAHKLAADMVRNLALFGSDELPGYYVIKETTADRLHDLAQAYAEAVQREEGVPKR